MEHAESNAITIDLNDLASITKVVRTQKTLGECLHHAKLVQKGSKASVVMSAKSWQAATTAKTRADIVDDVPFLITQIRAKQTVSESHLRELTIIRGLVTPTPQNWPCPEEGCVTAH